MFWTAEYVAHAALCVAEMATNPESDLVKSGSAVLPPDPDEVN